LEDVFDELSDDLPSGSTRPSHGTYGPDELFL
jgi:hypothetical protein